MQIEMLVSAAFFMAALFFAPGISCYFSSPKNNFSARVPGYLIVFCGFFFLTAALFRNALPYSPTKFAIIEVLSLIATHLLFRFRPIELPFAFGGKTLWLLCGLSLLCLLDVALIFNHQSWFHLYFRPPILNDQERNLILVNAILRGGLSPFLPNTPLSYPTFWHELCAVITGALGSSATLGTIFGFSLGTGFLFFLFILLMVNALRPEPVHRWWGPLAVALAISLHTDILNFILSIAIHGKMGMEADGSYAGPFLFRYFSPKLIALTAPQHALFLCIAICGLVIRHNHPLLIGIAFVSSPTLTILFFGPLACVRFFSAQDKRREFILGLSGFLLGVGLTGIVYRLSPWALIYHPWVSKLVVLPTWWGHWAALPLILVGIAGIPGVLLTIALINRRTEWKQFAFPVCFLVLGNLAVNNLVSEMELKRHFSILSTILVLFLLAQIWPKRIPQLRLGFLAGFGVLLHSYFLYSYLEKPSQLDPSIAWKDYFSMNEILRTKYPQMKVMASDSPRSGIDFPLTLETVTSFANILNSLVYGKLTPLQLKLLHKSEEAGTVLPYAERLGYQAVLLGPIEKREWDQKTIERFIDPELMLETEKTVSLYKLTDRLKNRFEKDTDKGSPAFYRRVATAFEIAGWKSEALGFWITATQLEPNNSMAQEAVARLQN